MLGRRAVRRVLYCGKMGEGRTPDAPCRTAEEETTPAAFKSARQQYPTVSVGIAETPDDYLEIGIPATDTTTRNSHHSGPLRWAHMGISCAHFDAEVQLDDGFSGQHQAARSAIDFLYW
jgi:hypothetical protein